MAIQKVTIKMAQEINEMYDDGMMTDLLQTLGE